MAVKHFAVILAVCVLGSIQALAQNAYIPSDTTVNGFGNSVSVINTNTNTARP